MSTCIDADDEKSWLVWLQHTALSLQPLLQVIRGFKTEDEPHCFAVVVDVTSSSHVYRRVLEESRAKVEQLRQQRAMAAIADNPEDGGRAGGSKKKRKKGGNEDMGDFYVDDAQPIERLPKAKKTDEDVQVGVLVC